MKYFFTTIAFTVLVIWMSVYVLPQNPQATIKIDTKNPMPDTTSRLIFGGFIEYLLDYVNGPNGMWAQEFMDRGFDILDCENVNIGCVWKEYKLNNDDSILTIPGGYNPNGEYFKRFIGKTVNSKTGVYQTIVACDTVKYSFYVYFKSDSPGSRLKLTVYDTNMSKILSDREIGTAGSKWKQIGVTIPVIKGYNRLNYLIYLDGKGTIDIDESHCRPYNNFHGVRHEYYNLLKGMNIGMLRYPGGWFADQTNNKLEYCIGDIDKRKSPNLKIGKEYQRMDMGLDEIVYFCKAINCESQLTLNFENGTAEETGNYVEYCNGNENTTWGRKRGENGFSEPFNIKYWEVGNEQWGHPIDYAKKYLTFYDKIKEKDPNAQVIIDGNCWDGLKDVDSLFSVVGDKCDYYSYHPAFGVDVDYNHPDSNIYITYIGFPNEMEKMIESFQEKLVSKNLYPDIMQGTTEWWTTYSSNKLGDWLIDTNTFHSSLMMGLINANMINIYLRHPDYFKFAERTIGIGLIRRSFMKDGSRSIFGIAPYQAIAMMSRHFGTHVYKADVTVEKYNPIFQPGLAFVQDVPWLDVTSTGTKDTLYLSVINRHPSKYVDATLDINSTIDSNKVYELNSDFYMDANTPDEPLKIVEKEKSIEVKNFYSFPPHSLTIIAFYCPELTGVDENNPSNQGMTINHEYNTSEFTISLPGLLNSDGVLSIFNYMGQLVSSLKIPANTERIDFNGIELPNGPYIFNFKSTVMNYSKLVMW